MAGEAVLPWQAGLVMLGESQRFAFVCRQHDNCYSNQPQIKTSPGTGLARHLAAVFSSLRNRN